MDTDRPRPGVGIYTADLAARLTTVPKSTLASWRASGLLRPSLRLDLPRVQQAYSYDDLGAILLTRELRGHGLSTERLRKAVTWFKSQVRRGERWTNRRVWTDGKDHFTFEPNEAPAEPVAGPRPEECGCSVFLPDVLKGFISRVMPALNDVGRYVEITPDVQAGQPVIRDTRLTTALVAGIAGPSVDVSRVHDLYPYLPAAAIKAAVTFEKALGRLDRLTA